MVKGEEAGVSLVWFGEEIFLLRLRCKRELEQRELELLQYMDVTAR